MLPGGIFPCIEWKKPLIWKGDFICHSAFPPLNWIKGIFPLIQLKGRAAGWMRKNCPYEFSSLPSTADMGRRSDFVYISSPVLLSFKDSFFIFPAELSCSFTAHFSQKKERKMIAGLWGNAIWYLLCLRFCINSKKGIGDSSKQCRGRACGWYSHPRYLMMVGHIFILLCRSSLNYVKPWFGQKALGLEKQSNSF